jgi:hypothetical protein
MLVGTAVVRAEPPVSALNPHTVPTLYVPTLYLAQLDDDDLDDVDDDFDGFDDIEDDIEDDVEDELEDQLEDELDDLAEDAAEDALNDEADDLVEELAKNALEDQMEDDLEDELEDSLDDDVGDLDDDQDTDDLDQSFDEDDQLADALEERLLDGLDEDLENLIELNTGAIIVRNQMLAVADDELLDRLARHPAIKLKKRQPLTSLGISLGRFDVRSTVSLEKLRAELRAAYPGLSVDFNHGYELNQGQLPASNKSINLSDFYRTTASCRARQVAIGMIDGPVNTDHPAFAKARLQQKAFVSNPSLQARDHGTAIASLLVGQTHVLHGQILEGQVWEGLAPDTLLYVASVFSEQNQYGAIATTQSLITALDWLVSQSVAVINISLAGPANQALETVLQRVRALGVVPIAAAGNAGPLADPQYPAAYPTVVAVTAIDRNRLLYSQAVRGSHLDFAAFGVDLLAASGNQGFNVVTGTSFAAPVVTGLLVRYLTDTGSLEEALQAVAADTLDLGEPGKDWRFGHGLPGKGQLRP